MNQQIEIPISKKKITLLLLGAIAFVIGGMWIALNPEEFIPNIFMITDPDIVRTCGIIGVLFFGLAMIYGIKKLFEKKAGLIINSEGIINNTHAAAHGLVEWEDIISIQTQQVMSTKFLMIYVRKPEKYIAKAKNAWQARLMKSNMNMYNTPISITPNTLSCNFKELEKLISEHFENYKSNGLSNKDDS